MARQREAARAAWKGSGDAAVEPIWFDLRESLGATEFLGYATTHAEGVVTALVVDGKPVERAEPGPVMVVTNQTPFYGEFGGQIGDTGTIRCGDAVVHGHRHAKAAGRPVRPYRPARGRAAGGGRRGRARGRRRPPRPHPPRALGHPPAARRAAPASRASTWRRRARWSHPTGCASTSASRGR